MSEAYLTRVLHTPPASSVSTTIYTACLIAEAFRGRVPTIGELRERFGMSRATAFRWRAAIAAAKGANL